jgi:hypothetical protein
MLYVSATEIVKPPCITDDADNIGGKCSQAVRFDPGEIDDAL